MKKYITIDVENAIGSPSALTREQGEIVYDMIKDKIALGENVLLDFGNIESLITPFLNVSIGKLYKDFSSETLKERLKILNVPEGKVSSFNLVIENAKRYYKDQQGFNRLVEEEVDV